jgi:hypothetical protein
MVTEYPSAARVGGKIRFNTSVRVIGMTLLCALCQLTRNSALHLIIVSNNQHPSRLCDNRMPLLFRQLLHIWI